MAPMPLFGQLIIFVIFFIFQVDNAPVLKERMTKRKLPKGSSDNTEPASSGVTAEEYARVVQKLQAKKQRICHLELELDIERGISRRLQEQLLDLLGKLLNTFGREASGHC